MFTRSGLRKIHGTVIHLFSQQEFLFKIIIKSINKFANRIEIFFCPMNQKENNDDKIPMVFNSNPNIRKLSRMLKDFQYLKF